jgi:inner membrane protein
MLSSVALHWLWISGGLALLALEVLAPGTFLFWIGLAAIATGLIVWVLPLPWPATLVIFAVGAVSAALLGRRLMAHRSSIPADAPHLHQRGAALVGRETALLEALAGGEGEVRIDDTLWRVTGPDLPAGTRVRVTAADGSRLRVERA